MSWWYQWGSGNNLHGNNWAYNYMSDEQQLARDYFMGTTGQFNANYGDPGSQERADVAASMGTGGYLVTTNDGTYIYGDRSFQTDFAGGGMENWYRAQDGGLWPTWTHNEIINMAFKNLLSQHQIKVLQDASLAADGPEFQTLEASYRHGMRMPGQSIEEAKSQAMKFIEHQRSLFIQGSGDEALRQLGFAMHTFMDMTSPSHSGWQVWEGTKSFQNKMDGISHVLGEMGYDSGIPRAAELIRSFYLESLRLKNGGN